MQRTSTQPENNHASLVAGVFILLLIVAVYAFTLTLPFYSDDIPIFKQITQQTIGDVITSPNVFGTYYRPVANAIYWLQYPAWAFYALNIFMHMINTVLAGQLARQLPLGKRGQIIVMFAFALMPVTAQAVMWIGANKHPMVTLFILLLSYAALRYLRQGKISWLITAWIAGILVPYTHENGILAVPIAGLVTLTVFGVRGLLQRWQATLAIFSPAMIATIIFLYIRSNLISADPTSINSEFVQQNFLFWLQWVTFPTQLLTRYIGNSTELQVLLGAGLFIAISGFVLIIYKRWRFTAVYSMAAIWAFAAFLPSILFLHPAYVIWSERLLYLAAPALAIIFAVLMMRLPRLAYYAALLLIVVGCGFLVNRYRADLIAHNVLYSELLKEFDENVAPDDAPLLLNLPAYSAYENSLLPLGSVRAFILSDWIELSDFFEVNIGKAYPNALGVHNFNTNDTWDNHAQAYFGRMVVLDELVAEIAAHDAFYRVRFDDTYELVKGGTRLDTPPTDSAYIFADGLLLENIDIIQNKITDTITVALDWRRVSEADLPYIAFVHLTCDGAIIDQSDAAPLTGLYPFAAWTIDEAWRDYRYLNISDANEDCLGLRVGLYDPNTANRATLTNPNGTDNADGFITLDVE